MTENRSRSSSSYRAAAARAIYLAAVLALAGCYGDSREPTGPSLPGKPSGQSRIALVMKSLANEFFATMAEGARRHLSASTPGTFELIVNGIKDERDLSRQVALVDEMVAQGVNAIVIAPADSESTRLGVQACSWCRRNRRQHRQQARRPSADRPGYQSSVRGTRQPSRGSQGG